MQNLLQNKRALDKQKKIALSVADKIEFVEIGSIVRCESESNYTTFYLKSGMKDGSSISISRQRRNYVMEVLKQL